MQFYIVTKEIQDSVRSDRRFYKKIIGLPVRTLTEAMGIQAKNPGSKIETKIY